MRAVTGRNWALIVMAHLLLTAGLVALLWQARSWALGELTRPAEREQWQTWRDDVRNRRDPQARTVARQVPKSSEPPALVLMRDYFAVCLVAAIAFGTVLYLVSVWLAVGAFSGAKAPKPQQPGR